MKKEIKNIVQELSEGKASEETNKKAINFLKILLAMLDSHLPIVMTEKDGSAIRAFSKGAEELFLYKEEEVSGTKAGRFYDDEEERQGIIEKLKAGEDVIKTEVKLKKSTGDVFFSKLLLTFMKDEEGNQLGSFGVPFDVTKEKLAASNHIINIMQSLYIVNEARVEFFRGHSERVASYATMILNALGHDKEKLEKIYKYASLHDVGKVTLDDAILSNREKFVGKNPLQVHCVDGDNFLKTYLELFGHYYDPVFKQIVRNHHERYDGTGYPDGLSGKNIPLEARAVAVADSFDAMTSERPYEPKIKSYQEAFEELRKCAGTQFDPEIVEIFIENFSRFAASLNSLYEFFIIA